MIQNITAYYRPQNPNIKSGKIYTIYLNKVNNLDLSSIINHNNTLNQIINSTPKKEEYTITKEEYNAIINILNETLSLSNKSQNLSKILTKGRK